MVSANEFCIFSVVISHLASHQPVLQILLKWDGFPFCESSLTSGGIILSKYLLKQIHFLFDQFRLFLPEKFT